MWYAIESGLHPAGAARFQWNTGEIDPEIHPGHHALRQVNLVVLEKGDATFERGILSRSEDALEHAFARFVGRMRLAGKNDLDGPPRVREEFP